jgi:hypothetical protein
MLVNHPLAVTTYSDRSDKLGAHKGAANGRPPMVVITVIGPNITCTG